MSCLLVGLFAGACSSPRVSRHEDNTDVAITRDQGREPGLTGLKLYFRNNNYNDGGDASQSVIPVIRVVSEEGHTARDLLNALISGPLPEEQNLLDVGPVIDGTGLQVEDIYIKSNICVIHLSSTHPLPLYGDGSQTDPHAETVLVQSLLYSFTDLPGVEAVWLFCNGKPWKNGTVDWLCPLTPPDRGLNCTLYFCKDMSSHPVVHGVDSLMPVRIRIVSTVDADATDCLFGKIMDLLSQGYGPLHQASLTQKVNVLHFNLTDHLLTIDLGDPLSGSFLQVNSFIGSLVYTFTGFPEIDDVLVTVEGRPLEQDGLTWNCPLCRDDF